MAYSTIDDPSAHFQTKLYTGTGSNQAYTNDGNSNLQPDWWWGKERNNSTDHHLYDSSRGVTKRLKSNGTDAEDTVSTGLTAFGSDGFTLGTSGSINGSSDTYVCWQWKANGGTTSTNDDGSVDVTIQVNSTAGFSIMKWNGNGSTSGTVGHGLGAIPDMIIEKYGLDGTSNWGVAFPKFETGKLIVLNDNSNGFQTASGLSSYNSSTFVDGNGASTGGTIAYAFKQIKGYSRFGFYVGNGDANGPMCYTGFKPAFVMIKRSNGSGNWLIFDSSRDPRNAVDDYVVAHAEQAEAEYDFIDFLSNGFKQRHTSSHANGDGDTYVYMAFADKPWVTSKGVVTTAV